LDISSVDNIQSQKSETAEAMYEIILSDRNQVGGTYVAGNYGQKYMTELCNC
jgi:hypothetical protein